MQEYSLVSLIRTLHAWRKPLITITVGAAVLSALISLLLPVYYRATTVFYAASQDLFKPQKIFGSSQSEMYYYGGTEDISRLITAASSVQVIDHLIDEFDLYTHYGIKQGTQKAAFRVREKLLALFKIVRTKHDAIEIIVEDRDPEMSAALANAVRNRINAVITGMIKGSQQDLLKSYKVAILAKELALSEISDSLRKFQTSYGIFDTEAQSEYLSTLLTSVETNLVRERGMLASYQANRNRPGVMDSIILGTARIAGLEQQKKLLAGGDTMHTSLYSFDSFIEGRGRVDLYTDAYRKAVNALNLDRELVKQMDAAVALDVTAVHIVQEATVPMVKARPVRSLIVVLSTLVALLFSVFGILLIESVRGQDWGFLKW